MQIDWKPDDFKLQVLENIPATPEQIGENRVNAIAIREQKQKLIDTKKYLQGRITERKFTIANLVLRISNMNKELEKLQMEQAHDEFLMSMTPN